MITLRPRDDVDRASARHGVEALVMADFDDAQTHYDLGVAYAEMGLVEDALSELELACQNSRQYRDAPELKALITRLRRKLDKPPNEPLH